MGPNDNFDGLPSYHTFGRGKQAVTSKSPFIVAIFMPWVLFTFISAIVSFESRFKQPRLSWVVVFTVLALVLLSGISTARKVRQRVASDAPHWYVFFFASNLLAWLLAVSTGDNNYATNMNPFYDVVNLNAYGSVDPVVALGNRFMDAGRLEFLQDARVDVDKAVGFRDLDTYCVAPIARGNATLARYDFWAVGVNCCGADGTNFHCGESRNPAAHSGLRLMREDLRAFFRLAVQRAEAENNIKSVHPLFFTWMQDPKEEIVAYQDEGYMFFMMGVCGHFIFQAFLVVVATFVFPRT